jgi:hypothetical protein
MIGHPAIAARFNWIVGEGWYMSVNIGSVAVNPPGCVGNFLHGGGFADPAHFSTAGRPHTSMCNYAWQLQDVGPDDGGFVLVRCPARAPNNHYCSILDRLARCAPPAHRLTDWSAAPAGHDLKQIPASHKMLWPVPRPKHTSMDLGAVRHLECSAGSVVIYFNQTAHGVWGWRGKTERRAVMSKAFNRLHPSPSKL